MTVEEIPAENGSRKELYGVVHVSFQSTMSTHTTTTNTLDKIDLCVCQREKGLCATTQTWGIELNEGGYFYLESSDCVDQIDGLIDKCGIGFISCTR